MSFVIDILLIALFSLIVYRAAKIGFIKSVLRVVALILAFIVAAKISAISASYIYDAFLSKTVVSMIEARLPEITGETLSIQLANQFLDKIPDSFLEIAKLMGVETGKLTSSFTTLNLQRIDVANELANSIAKPIIVSVLKIVIYILMLIILIFVFRKLVNIISKFFKLPVIKSANKLLGACIGAFRGLFTIISLSIVLKCFGLLFGDGSFGKMIESSRIINMICSGNFMINLFG